MELGSGGPYHASYPGFRYLREFATSLHSRDGVIGVFQGFRTIARPSIEGRGQPQHPYSKGCAYLTTGVAAVSSPRY